MKKITVLLLAGVLASLIAGAASADTRMDRRERLQRERIAQGWRHGQLTRGERRRLVRGQIRVHRMERRALADGRLTRGERWRMERMQDRQSRRIHRLRHNHRVRSL